MSEYQSALPDVNTAEAQIADRVHIAAYLDKLASVRPQYLPQTQEQLSELLQIGATIYAAEGAQKQAAALPANSPFGLALYGLQNVLQGSVIDVGVKQAAADQAQEQLYSRAAALAADPEIYASAVSIKLAQAQATA